MLWMIGVTLEEEVWHCRDDDFPIAPRMFLRQRDTFLLPKRKMSCVPIVVVELSFSFCWVPCQCVWMFRRASTSRSVLSVDLRMCWLRPCLSRIPFEEEPPEEVHSVPESAQKMESWDDRPRSKESLKCFLKVDTFWVAWDSLDPSYEDPDLTRWGAEEILKVESRCPSEFPVRGDWFKVETGLEKCRTFSAIPL